MSSGVLGARILLLSTGHSRVGRVKVVSGRLRGPCPSVSLGWGKADPFCSQAAWRPCSEISRVGWGCRDPGRPQDPPHFPATAQSHVLLYPAPQAWGSAFLRGRLSSVVKVSRPHVLSPHSQPWACWEQSHSLVANVVPTMVILVEALHGPHVGSALGEATAGLAGYVGMVDVQKAQWQVELLGFTLVGSGFPHTTGDDGWALCRQMDIAGWDCSPKPRHLLQPPRHQPWCPCLDLCLAAGPSNLPRASRMVLQVQGPGLRNRHIGVTLYPCFQTQKKSLPPPLVFQPPCPMSPGLTRQAGSGVLAQMLLSALLRKRQSPSSSHPWSISVQTFSGRICFRTWEWCTGAGPSPQAHSSHWPRGCPLSQCQPPC